MQKQYAKALARMKSKDAEGGKTLVDNLVVHLKAAGRMKMLPKILAELKTLAAREAVKAPFLEVASESEKAHALKEVETQGIEKPHTVVNHDLIHGYRVRAHGTLVDRSGKQALVSIYKQITH